MSGRSAGPLRPAGAPRPALSLLALGAALFLAARTSGSGWVLVVLCGLLGIVVVGAAWPAVTLARLRVRVAGAPRDGRVGTPLAVNVGVVGTGPGVRLRVRVGPAEGAWQAAVGDCAGALAVVPSRRGVEGMVDVEAVADGPLGLVPWRRHWRLPLPRPLEVAPCPAEVPPSELQAATSEPEASPVRGVAAPDSLFRGVRPYVAGDARRLVHWPASARWGRLMVRETDPPGSGDVVLVVDLRGDPQRAEDAAARAAGLAQLALSRGLTVVLCTAEADGPRQGPVASGLEAGRRLARAVGHGAPADPPESATACIRVKAGP